WSCPRRRRPAGKWSRASAPLLPETVNPRERVLRRPPRRLLPAHHRAYEPAAVRRRSRREGASDQWWASPPCGAVEEAHSTRQSETSKIGRDLLSRLCLAFFLPSPNLAQRMK